MERYIELRDRGKIEGNFGRQLAQLGFIDVNLLFLDIGDCDYIRGDVLMVCVAYFKQQELVKVDTTSEANSLAWTSKPRYWATK